MRPLWSSHGRRLQVGSAPRHPGPSIVCSAPLYLPLNDQACCVQMKVEAKQAACPFPPPPFSSTPHPPVPFPLKTCADDHDQLDIAFSKAFLGGGGDEGVRVSEQASFSVQTVAPGRTLALGAAGGGGGGGGASASLSISSRTPLTQQALTGCCHRRSRPARTPPRKGTCSRWLISRLGGQQRPTHRWRQDLPNASANSVTNTSDADMGKWAAAHRKLQNSRNSPPRSVITDQSIVLTGAQMLSLLSPLTYSARKTKENRSVPSETATLHWCSGAPADEHLGCHVVLGERSFKKPSINVRGHGPMLITSLKIRCPLGTLGTLGTLGSLRL